MYTSRPWAPAIGETTREGADGEEEEEEATHKGTTAQKEVRIEGNRAIT